MKYINANGIQLPKQYPHVMDSLECWNCTVPLTMERIEFMRMYYPELLNKLKPDIKSIYGAVMKEFEKIWPVVMNALEGERL